MNRLTGYLLSAIAEFGVKKTRTRPLVSVVIATYNRAGNVRLAIESVLRQSYPNFEVLVVGDGCTDNTEEVVTAIPDSRVKWLSLPNNSGSQSMPNNLGISAASGDYIAYLGHDDVWLPDHLAVLVRAMEAKSLQVASTRCFSIGPARSNALMLSGPRVGDSRRVTGPPSALCHRKDIVARSGPWRDYKSLPPDTPPDSEFIDRVVGASARKIVLRRVTVVKLNAAWRKGFYQQKNSEEQAYWLERSRRPHRLVLGLLAKAVWLSITRAPVSLPTHTEARIPGEHIVDTWRRIKGLPAR